MLYLYFLLTILLLPLYPIWLIVRLLQKKEEVGRVLERFGVTQQQRPPGRLVWFHAASMGEATAALSLINQILQTHPGVRILVTTGTKSSAQLLNTRLPKGAVHQFLPMDNPLCVHLFLQHWRPDLGVFIESEIWPCLIHMARLRFPILLFNAKLSDSSYAAWGRLPGFFKSCIRCFDCIVAQGKEHQEKFAAFGAENVRITGSVKFANAPLPVDEGAFASLSAHLCGRKVVVFASTHYEDEVAMRSVITSLKTSYPSTEAPYFIVVPRHPERQKQILNDSKQAELTCSLRSLDRVPPLDEDLYVADTFGELGLFYKLSNIAFVGGSFEAGGHNPIEAAHFDTVVMFGPNMSSCLELAHDMVEAKAALQVSGVEDLLNKLSHLLSASEEEIRAYKQNAQEFVTQRAQQVISFYINIIDEYLNNYENNHMER